MKRVLVSAGAVVAFALSAGATGGKVNIPREGSYDFDFCPIGRGKVFSAGDKLFVMNYDLDAILRSTPPGKAFDRMGARCFGIYSNINGRQQEAGICELTDLDGDKWWMDYRGNPDGKGGTYMSAHGQFRNGRGGSFTSAERNRPCRLRSRFPAIRSMRRSKCALPDWGWECSCRTRSLRT